MKRIILIKFLFLILFNSYSQSKVFCVYDELNNETLPFVKIKLFKNNKLINGLYSNSKGEFQIEDLSNVDVIELLYFGYKNLEIYNFSSDTIFLEKEVIQLNEIVVSSCKKKAFQEVGVYKDKKISEYATTSGQETIVYVENTKDEIFYIKSVFVKIIRRKNHTSVVRINFYERMKDSIYPLENKLISSKYFYLEGNSKKIHEFDLENLNLEFPSGGIFVGMEWVGIYDHEKDVFINDDTFDTILELNDALNKPLTFVRNNLRGVGWSSLSQNLLKYNLVKTDNYPNISIGLKIFK